MRVALFTDDPAFAEEVRANFDAARGGLSWVIVAPGGAAPLCAVALFDAAALAHAPAESLPAGARPRWLIRRDAAVSAPAQGDWQSVIGWPPDTAELGRLLGELATAIRANQGIAPPAVLAAGLQRIVELASESIELADLSVRLLYVNPAFEEITGWSLEDAVGHTTADLFRAGTHDPAYYATIVSTLRRGEVWRGPLIGRRRNDELSFQEATIAPVLGSDGGPVAFIAIKRDLARDALAHQALESHEQRLHTMLEGAGDGVLVHDGAGVLADVNPSACAMLGREREELLSLHRMGDLLEGHAPADLKQVFLSLRVGEPTTLEGRFRRPDGTAVDVSLRLGAFMFGGERFILTLARDVSERVQLERRLHEQTAQLAASLEELRLTQRELVQREKLAALGTLVAGVAHEVNTPLGVALTALSLCDDALFAMRDALSSPTPSRRTILARMSDLSEALTLAHENGRRAATLVADFKKVAVDQASEAEREIDLQDYLPSILSALSPMLRKENVEVVFSGESIVLRTRPGAIAQVLSNIIQNAVTHAFDGYPGERRVSVRCAREHDRAVIEVTDRGVGIAPDILARVFDPFVSSRMGSGGSGLGMHVVHNLVVEVLGGRVDVMSEPGLGTRVTVMLPLARA